MPEVEVPDVQMPDVQVAEMRVAADHRQDQHEQGETAEREKREDNPAHPVWAPPRARVGGEYRDRPEIESRTRVHVPAVPSKDGVMEWTAVPSPIGPLGVGAHREAGRDRLANDARQMVGRLAVETPRSFR